MSYFASGSCVIVARETGYVSSEAVGYEGSKLWVARGEPEQWKRGRNASVCPLASN